MKFNTQAHRPSLSEKLFFFLSGAIISIPLASMANSLVGSYLSYLYTPTEVIAYASIFAAPVFEEFTKCYPLFYRHGETEKSIMTLGLLTGFGFGVTEFCLYVFAYGVPPIDRLPLVFFHAANTAVVAYGISKKRALPFFVLATILHAVYNYLIQNGTGLAFLVVFLSVLLYLALFKRSQDRFYDYSQCEVVANMPKE